jgi:hypothetical protein
MTHLTRFNPLVPKFQDILKFLIPKLGIPVGMFELTTLHFFTFMEMCLSLRTSFQIIALVMIGFGCKSKARFVTCSWQRCENHLLREDKINTISLIWGKTKFTCNCSPTTWKINLKNIMHPYVFITMNVL